jgi:Peptidase family M48
MGLLLACQSAAGAEAFHSTSRSVEYYVQTHGRVDPARLTRAYAVFDSVRSVADKSGGVWPELVVVDDKQQAAAFVLADGTIVLSRKALDIIGSGVEPALADTRLAFVLGHELAHLATNDFWDHQITAAIGPEARSRELARAVEVDADQQRRELKADDLGFLYAALAGYRVDALVQSSAAAQGFLAFWTSQIGGAEDARYPSAAARTELLRLRLDDRLQSLQAFNFGVRLIQFGRYRDGLALLREFQQHFPSREVFNNLGFAHLHLALDRLPPELAFHYWLPGVADLHTPLSRLTLRASAPAQGRMQWRIPPAAREDLLDAARYFELAIAKDAKYASAHVNLATTQLLLGLEPRAPRANATQLLRAESATAAAQALAPNDPQVRVLGAIVRFEREQADAGSSTAAPRIPQSLDSDEPTLNYNLARLLAASPDADRFWNKALGQFESLPTQVRSLICAQSDARVLNTRSEPIEQCNRASLTQSSPSVPWPMPIKLSRDLLDEPWTDAEKSRFDSRITQLARSKVFGGSSLDVLAIDDITAMTVLKDVAGTSATLLQCCGSPATRIAVASGELWRYGNWIAWLRDGRIREVWITN